MKNIVKKIIDETIKDLGYKISSSYKLEVPPKTNFGDYATNVAMILSNAEKMPPREIAEKITKKLEQSDKIEKVEIAGPGFINIFLKSRLYWDELKLAIKAGPNYGRLNIGKNEKIQVEYISANPTGPLHIGNARGGPIGQSLANLYSFLGYDVTSEFYINDIGGQIERLGESLYYWYAKKTDDRVVFPEGGYPGAYIEVISEKIQEDHKAELDKLKDKSEILALFKKEGLYHTVKSIREDAELLGIKFDTWINQSDFEYSGKSDLIIEKLIERDATVQKEGALWFKSPEDPDLQDRECVLKKSDESGTMTYFTDDIAYHVDKFDRGFKKVIDVWGANHSGHVPRMKAALSCLGYPAKNLEIILYQYVRLKNAGEVVSMGKRLGNFVTIPQILENGVTPDAFKYFILSQNPNTPFDFDLKLAADTTEKNPVFYIKYAHARISSIFKKAIEAGENTKPEALENADFNLLTDPREQALIKEITSFPELIVEISENFQIQTLPHYVYKIATLFHDFYAHCQVIEKNNKDLTKARLALITVTRQVLYNSLLICGIDAPEQM